MTAQFYECQFEWLRQFIFTCVRVECVFVDAYECKYAIVFLLLAYFTCQWATQPVGDESE